jgi:hypothetical protein
MTNDAENCRKISAFCAALLVIILAGTCLAPQAKADTTYSYTGTLLNNFFGSDSCTGGLGGVGECQVTGTITLSSPLGDNMTVVCCGENVFDVVSFSFTDGFGELTQTNSEGSFDFGTDSSGTINAWNIGIGTDAICGVDNCYVIGSLNATFGSIGDSSTNDGTTPVSFTYNDTAGTWKHVSTTSVPEPATLLLLGTGLLTVFTRRPKRRT